MDRCLSFFCNNTNFAINRFAIKWSLLYFKIRNIHYEPLKGWPKNFVMFQFHILYYIMSGFLLWGIMSGGFYPRNFCPVPHYHEIYHDKILPRVISDPNNNHPDCVLCNDNLLFCKAVLNSSSAKLNNC